MATVRQAVQLYLANLGVIALVVTTVYLPINALIFFAVNHVFDPNDLAGNFRITMFLEGIFGPVATGAVIYVAWQETERSSVTYGEALTAGLSCWSRLFATRLVAGLIVCLGLLAFVVPGIILGIRYALIDSAVVVEQIGGRDARVRSSDLTEGIRLWIFAVGVVCYTCFMVVASMLYLPLEFLPADMGFVEVALDCVADIIFAFVDVLFFVVFWNARGSGDDATAEEQAEDDEFPSAPDMQGKAFDIPDDQNPYRPPDLR